MSEKAKKAASAAHRYKKSEMACNKPQKTSGHPKKSHIVKACEGGKEKIIRFGEQGAETAGKPKAGESERMKQTLQKAGCRLLTGQIKLNGDLNGKSKNYFFKKRIEAKAHQTR